MLRNLFIGLLLLFNVSLSASIPRSNWVNIFGGNADTTFFLFPSIVSSVVDQEGNVYSLGNFSGSFDFDYSAGENVLTTNGDVDVFITKHDSNGNLLFAKNFGGEKRDIAISLHLDSESNIYIAGTFKKSIDFDLTKTDPYIVTLEEDYYKNSFIVKYNPLLELQFVKVLESDGDVDLLSMNIDNNDDIIITGTHISPLLVSKSPDIYLDHLHWNDVYMVKINKNGEYLNGGTINSNGDEILMSISFDKYNNIYVIYNSGSFAAGHTVDVNFNPSIETLLESEGYGAIYAILKYNSDLELLSVMDFTAANNIDYINISGLHIDNEDNIYINGNINGRFDFDLGDDDYFVQSKLGGGSTSFVVKYNSSEVVQWVNLIDYFGDGVISNPIFDEMGNFYQFGYHSDGAVWGIDFVTYPPESEDDITYDKLFINEVSYSKGFITKYDMNGDFVDAFEFGDNGTCIITSLNVNASNKILLSIGGKTK